MGFWATSGGAHGSLTLLFGSHLDKLLLHGNKWAVTSSSSTVHVISTAEPVLLWATSSGAHGSITLLLGSHLDKFLLHATIGQSASVAAQYMLSAQQNQLTSGQP